MKKLKLRLSIVAGLFGGLLSHYVWPQPVQAQIQLQIPAPKEVRAQSFVLVDDKGKVQGVFTFNEPTNGRPSVELFDGNGREIWSAGGSPLRPLVGSVTPK
jgi:hypothetical protein